MRRLGVLAGVALFAVATPVAAAPPSTSVPPVVDESGGTTDEGGSGGDVPAGEPAPPLTLPLVPVPSGCTPPQPAHIVFLGTVVERDYRTVRFRIDQIKWGRPDPFAAERRNGRQQVVDVRYGLDTQYLADGEQYLVGAVVDPVLGLLVSRVGEKIEDFGGDEVIGVSETDANCPAYEDADRTLHPDGTEIDTPMLAPFFEAKWRIAGSVVAPLGIACGVLFVLSAFKLTIFGGVRRLLRR